MAGGRIGLYETQGGCKHVAKLGPKNNHRKSMCKPGNVEQQGIWTFWAVSKGLAV